MDCPQCKGSPLEPSQLEEGLLASICSKCSGALVPLMNFRFWANKKAVDSGLHEQATEAVTFVKDSSDAKLCPKCNRLMTKFKVDLDVTNRIDLCGHCDEAWLDKGEWELLEQLDVQGQLPSIFTKAWQRNMRLERQVRSDQAHYESVLGEQDFSKMLEFKQWLESHEHSTEIKLFLAG